MAKPYRQALGNWGEQAAADYLSAQGYVIMQRNVRTPFGEIDLVALQDNPSGTVSAFESEPQVVVFVEVKTRSSTAFGLPEESVTPRKRAHLLAAIQAFMQERGDLPPVWRVDVIAIRRQPDGRPPEIIHFENAIR